MPTTVAPSPPDDPLRGEGSSAVTEELLDDVDRQLTTEPTPVTLLADNAGWSLDDTMRALQELDRDGAVLRWDGASVARVWVEDPPMTLVLCDWHRCRSEIEVPMCHDGKPDSDVLEEEGWAVSGLRTFCSACVRQGHGRVAEAWESSS